MITFTDTVVSAIRKRKAKAIKKSEHENENKMSMRRKIIKIRDIIKSERSEIKTRHTEEEKGRRKVETNNKKQEMFTRKV